MYHFPEMNKTRSSFDTQSLTSPTNLKSLASVKKARKQIESDAVILANRLALLKQEELKAWKKIEDLKKKTQDVYTLKKKQEEREREVSSLH